MASLKSALRFAGIPLAILAIPFLTLVWTVRYHASDPEQHAALDKLSAGRQLLQDGRYLEAIEHFRAVKDYEGSRWADSSPLTGLIGRALDLAGHTEEARRLIDASLAGQKCHDICIFKAHFLARHESEESAIAWLNSVQIEDSSRAWAIASFHQERGRHAAAIPLLKDILGAAEGHHLLVDGAIRVPATMDSATRSQIGSLLDPLQDLAEIHLRVRKFDAANEYAKLGIQVGQLLNRDKTYLDTKHLRAGDLQCRLVRAQVLMQRGEWDAAGQEIEFAKAVADSSRCSESIAAVQSATQELQRRRPKR